MNCRCCGECCGTILPLSDRDISRIREWLKRHEGIHPITESRGLDCPFLKDNQCEVYEVRPYICQQFFCGKKPGKEEQKMFAKNGFKIYDLRRIRWE